MSAIETLLDVILATKRSAIVPPSWRYTGWGDPSEVIR